jgi:hypothetical protein
MTAAALIAAVAAVLAGALTARCTIFSRLQVRRLRWRTMARMRPAAGFASIPELIWRWSRIAAARDGKTTRPSMSLAARLAHPDQCAVPLGRGPWFIQCWGSPEHHDLSIAPPRSYKTANMGTRIIRHPGAALVHETRTDLYDGTARWRYERGPVEVFNPEGTGGIPSTFGWAMTAGCGNPSEALYRATDLVGAIAGLGEMQWWAEKAQVALAAGVHFSGLLTDDPDVTAAIAIGTALETAGVLGGDVGDVWNWAFGADGGALLRGARDHPGVSPALVGALAELDRPGKTADSIRITMTKSLGWLAIPALRNMVTGPAARPFDVRDWVDSCGTIYMISPGGEDAPAAPLFRAFTSYVRRQAIACAHTRPRRRLDPGVLFALDEIDKCLAAGSLVLTRDGYTPIEEVKVGDQVLTHAGRWRRVLAKTFNGTRPVVQVRAQGVPALRLTPDHRLWARTARPPGRSHQRRIPDPPDWMPAADTVGAYLHLPLPPVEASPISERDWWIVGRWLGDGHIGGDGRSYFICCAHDELPELLAGLGDRAGFIDKRRTAYVVRLNISANDPIKTILHSCGTTQPTRKVPAAGLALCQDKAEMLLAGFLAADGWYHAEDRTWRASSVSRALLLSMAMVAQRARGSVASVYAGRPPRKCVIEGRTVQAKQEWTMIIGSGRGLRKSSWTDPAGGWKKVRRIAETDPAEVWDLTVEGDHSFIAEGCAVSNCPVNLPGWLADSGASGVRIDAVCHSPGQLEDKYGRAGLNTIWNTTGRKYFMPGNHDPRLLQDLSVLGGTLPGGEARGLNPVIPAEFVQRLPRRWALCINANLFPVVLRVKPHWRHRRFGRRPPPPVLTPAPAGPAAATVTAPDGTPALTGTPVA